MQLKKHCQKVKARLEVDLITEPYLDDDAELFRVIKARIGKHQIPMNVLRAYSAIYLFQNVRQLGMTLDQLKAVMLEEDYVIDLDIIDSLNRLQSINLIFFDGKQYSLIDQ